jgi:hypothetical protein
MTALVRRFCKNVTGNHPIRLTFSINAWRAFLRVRRSETREHSLGNSSSRVLRSRPLSSALVAATTFSPILNGCWTLAGGHGKIDPAQFVNVACEHMSAGLTTFDTADIYGPSESILGQFRQAWEGKKAAGAPPPEVCACASGCSPPATSCPPVSPENQHLTAHNRSTHNRTFLQFEHIFLAADLHQVCAEYLPVAPEQGCR